MIKEFPDISPSPPSQGTVLIRPNFAMSPIFLPILLNKNNMAKLTNLKELAKI